MTSVTYAKDHLDEKIYSKDIQALVDRQKSLENNTETLKNENHEPIIKTILEILPPKQAMSPPERRNK
jgi:phosphohistidine phosphatase SixA